MPSLLDPLKIGTITLKNRVIMAPLTRSRSGKEGVPTDLMVQYYRQRASAGLIITEASPISPFGIGYINTPGIYTAPQIEGWKKITEAVHQVGGRIFIQLWHVGRVSHSSFHGGALPVAPSAIAGQGTSFTYDGPRPLEIPRALELEEIPKIIDQYRQAAKNADLAGFDGVEIHGANGYLPDQFLRNGSNHRTDQYGGSIENRARFLLEITQAAIDELGPHRVAVRLSPEGTLSGVFDSDPASILGYAVQKLNELPLAYLHLTERFESVRNPTAVPQLQQKAIFQPSVAAYFRPLYQGILIGNGGFQRDTACRAVESGTLDAVAFGKLFISNPDLPRRLAQDLPLQEADRATFYGGGAAGYTDYPSLG